MSTSLCFSDGRRRVKSGVIAPRAAISMCLPVVAMLPFLSGGRSRLYGDGHVVLSQSAIKMLHKQAAVFLTVHQTKQMQVHRPCFPGCGPQTDEGARQTCRMPALTHTHAPEPCRANSHLVCLPILSNPTDELSFRFWAAE